MPNNRIKIAAQPRAGFVLARDVFTLPVRQRLKYVGSCAAFWVVPLICQVRPHYFRLPTIRHSSAHTRVPVLSCCFAMHVRSSPHQHKVRCHRPVEKTRCLPDPPRVPHPSLTTHIHLHAAEFLDSRSLHALQRRPVRGCRHRALFHSHLLFHRCAVKTPRNFSVLHARRSRALVIPHTVADTQQSAQMSRLSMLFSRDILVWSCDCVVLCSAQVQLPLQA